MIHSTLPLKKRWIYNPVVDDALVDQLKNSLGIDQVLARVLVQRGVSDFESAKTFFRPSLDMLHDPFQMKDMDVAVARILRALESKEKILVYGDYDVDGTTSVALVYSFLKSLHADVCYYIPDRYTEGYGISFAGIDYAKKHGFSLIIALDCGIKSIDKVLYANEHEIDFIICDHHLPGDEIPEAVAVLDPKRDDCGYPYKELSGCGIGFKLCEAIVKARGANPELIYPYLDLVAVSIGADIVPLTGENRVMAYFGLKQINSNPRPGLASLIEVSGFRKELSINNVVFMIGPRINAAGRIDTGMDAVELLVSEDKAAAMKVAQLIDQHNQARRDLDISITQEALSLLDSQIDLLTRKSTVLFKEDWHKGVIGIVASRVIEKHYKPTILLTASNGKATGSARSVHGFDVYAAIEACSDLLDQFGGHRYAAGLTMRVENVQAFTEKFEREVAARISDDELVPPVHIDAELDLTDINPRFYRILKQLEPFGPGNMSPVFVTRGVRSTGRTRAVGKAGEHLSLEICQEQNRNCVFKGIAFGEGSQAELLNSGMPFDLAYHLDENEYRGEVSLQLRIKDIQVHGI